MAVNSWQFIQSLQSMYKCLIFCNWVSFLLYNNRILKTVRTSAKSITIIEMSIITLYKFHSIIAPLYHVMIIYVSC